PIRVETWQETSAPYDERQITTTGDRRFESATQNGTPQLYDASTNTIYAASPQVMPPAKRAAMAGEQKASTGDPYRDKTLARRASGQAHADGQVTGGGREAPGIVPDGGSLSLLVDARTSEPIEWRVNEDGHSAVARFPIYERLAATDAEKALV